MTDMNIILDLFFSKEMTPREVMFGMARELCKALNGKEIDRQYTEELLEEFCKIANSNKI